MNKIAVSILFAVLSVIFTLGTLGEKNFQNKKLYAATAFAVFVLLLISVVI